MKTLILSIVTLAALASAAVPSPQAAFETLNANTAALLEQVEE